MYVDKINVQISDRNITFSNLSIYYTWKNIRKSYKNNDFKMSTPKWNGELQLPDRFYHWLAIQD